MLEIYQTVVESVVLVVALEPELQKKLNKLMKKTALSWAALYTVLEWLWKEVRYPSETIYPSTPCRLVGHFPLNIYSAPPYQKIVLVVILTYSNLCNNSSV